MSDADGVSDRTGNACLVRAPTGADGVLDRTACLRGNACLAGTPAGADGVLDRTGCRPGNALSTGAPTGAEGWHSRTTCLIEECLVGNYLVSLHKRNACCGVIILAEEGEAFRTCILSHNTKIMIKFEDLDSYQPSGIVRSRSQRLSAAARAHGAIGLQARPAPAQEHENQNLVPVFFSVAPRPSPPGVLV